MEQVITLQLSNNQEATYSVNLNILPIGIYSGLGDWSGNWDLSGNKLIGIQILTGNGEYIGCGTPSTVLFKSKLQITRKKKRRIPYPEPDAETGIWEGSLSLVGGNVQGFLSNTSGNEYPSVYNLDAVYNRRCVGSTIITDVSNIKLSI
jgi:hypothetical protein